MDSKERKAKQASSWVKPSKRAKRVLDRILEIAASEKNEETTDTGYLRDVEAEKIGKKILSIVSGRDALRVLFITRDISVLTKNSMLQKQLLDLGSVFDEVHVIVLSVRSTVVENTLRVGTRMWIYPTNSKYWWKTMYDAYILAKTQLIFGKTFRPDVVVSLDPFESGIAGHFIANRYKRPHQVHVTEDFTDSYFKNRSPHNRWRLLMARYVLNRVQSVRVGSNVLIKYVKNHFRTKGQHIKELPIYFDLKHVRDASPSFSLKERYPQFSFILLTASELTEEAHVRITLDGAVRVLKEYKKIGFVIVGNGPRRKYLERRAIALNVQNQVMFEPWTQDLVSHIKTADLYINAGVDRRAERQMLEVAASGLPFVSVATDTLSTLFEGEDAGYFCRQNDVNCFTKNITTFLNNNELRTRFSKNASVIVFDRLEQDYEAYKLLYRDHIEMSLIEDM